MSYLFGLLLFTRVLNAIFIFIAVPISLFRLIYLYVAIEKGYEPKLYFIDNDGSDYLWEEAAFLFCYIIGILLTFPYKLLKKLMGFYVDWIYSKENSKENSKDVL